MFRINIHKRIYVNFLNSQSRWLLLDNQEYSEDPDKTIPNLMELAGHCSFLHTNTCVIRMAKRKTGHWGCTDQETESSSPPWGSDIFIEASEISKSSERVYEHFRQKEEYEEKGAQRTFQDYRRTQRVLRARGKVAREKAECLGRGPTFLAIFRTWIYSEGIWNSLNTWAGRWQDHILHF